MRHRFDSCIKFQKVSSLVEQSTHNRSVTGSSPVLLAKTLALGTGTLFGTRQFTKRCVLVKAKDFTVQSLLLCHAGVV
jgi:hypothetical protein